MGEVRFRECRDKPGYFEVFQEAKTKGNNAGKPPTSKHFDPNDRTSVEQRISTGPGTELILMLSSKWWQGLGIKVTAGCKCIRHARMMNEQGPDWCVENAAVIIGWLKDEHNHQRIRMPFLSTVAAMLIRSSIKRARRHE